MALLPLQTRVMHAVLGEGTIVGYNSEPSPYDPLLASDLHTVASSVIGMLTAVGSFYTPGRFPYVIEFDGYGHQDVYDVDGAFVWVIK